MKGRNGGKTKAWRKIKRQVNPETGEIQRYGKAFRNAMFQFNSMKASGYPLLNGLLAWNGYIKVNKPVIEGETNAA